MYPGLRVCGGRLAGIPSVPVHQGALWSAQLRPVFCQSAAAHCTVLPQPWCVFNMNCTCSQLHMFLSHTKSHMYMSMNNGFMLISLLQFDSLIPDAFEV